MPDDDQIDTVDTSIDLPLDTVVELALSQIDDPQEEIATIEQAALPPI